MRQADSPAADHAGIPPLHVIDLIRRKRDGAALDAREIRLSSHRRDQWIYPAGAARGLVDGCLAARGLSLDETRALTLAMRDSGEIFSPAGLGKAAVDKHSTGGVG